jgi:flagellar basal body-associated protein FliL
VKKIIFTALKIFSVLFVLAMMFVIFTDYPEKFLEDAKNKSKSQAKTMEAVVLSFDYTTKCLDLADTSEQINACEINREAIREACNSDIDACQKIIDDLNKKINDIDSQD